MKIIIGGDKIPVAGGGVGLFFEDINYALDGGLYAEMLENRNFEAKDACGERNRFTVKSDGGYGWEAYPGGAPVALKIKTDRPLFAENPHYLRLTAKHCGCGVKNKAYDGIYLTKNMKYRLSFWARSYEYKGGAAVGVYSNGEPLMEKKVKIKADGKWREYAFTLKSKQNAERADFAFTLKNAGTVHLDCFSMMPENAIKGVFRRDLAELMKNLNPGFLRFPGGCVVEGNGLANRYQWKNSLGPKEHRRHNWNRWAVHDAKPEHDYRTKLSHYGQTLGVGFYEYFLLCEYLGAKPLPVLNVGLACQFASEEFVPLDDPELEGYVQDALDLIEFANGGIDTEWGRVRAEMGHYEPFNLEYLALGNEQWQDEKQGNKFYERFELFEKRIHEAYPTVKIIGTAGPSVQTPSHADALNWTRKKLAENPDFVYATDEHFYVSPEWLYNHVNVYDGYPRDARIYVGEYAAHLPETGKNGVFGPDGNAWEGALAEAAFMTGMERNADVVVMASYAPLFARVGYAQWSPNLIWFDGNSCVASANYYVQMLFSWYTGRFSLKTEVEGGDCVYASATEREGLVFVKAVNAGNETAEVQVEGDFDFGVLNRIIRMEGALTDYNTLEEPQKVMPQNIAPTAERTLELPPRSFNVLVFRK